MYILLKPPAFIVKDLAIHTIRSFLQKELLYEVQTPILSKFSGIEPFIHPLTLCSQSDNIQSKYLTTSPELNLKKMLAFFYNNNKGIFEIAHAFRDEKKSRLHSKEFTLAEWYVKDYHYLTFAKIIDTIITYLIEAYKQNFGKKINHSTRYENSSLITVENLFKTVLTISLQPQTSWLEYQNIGLALGCDDHILINYKPSSYYEEEWIKIQIFQIIFDQYIVPSLKEQGVCHVYSFPPFLRGMASLNKAGWAERVECYIDGIEISNGYQELSSPEELKEIWIYNNYIRTIDNKAPHPLDELLLEVIHKIKGVAGIALGVERILIALGMATNMKEFTWPCGN